ncbi:ImmA/IrrE family metallo-endopeptidase [Brevibacterium oceani]|uniref:ImmA/IrrE family metallo-endopeptidase n=1 Tax=Brevibacterium oceani TaxID=358099 RepID=UPI0015E65A65|nr:ImmA/IrrE family metallo-endopeptidase [Brevibacterium oceani]
MARKHYHPWRELRSREHLELTWADLPPGVRGLTDGSSAIWMEPRQLQVERRCTLSHELAHIDLGHTTKPTVAEENATRRLAAQKLITWDALVDVFKWAHNAHEAADELWVTPEVLEDRLRFLHPNERALLALIGAARHG